MWGDADLRGRGVWRVGEAGARGRGLRARQQVREGRLWQRGGVRCGAGGPLLKAGVCLRAGRASLGPSAMGWV